MKYSNLNAFHKQLKGSAPDNFSSLYGMVVKDPYERRYMCRKVHAFLRHYVPDMEWEMVSDPKGFTLDSSSLFTSKRLVVIDGVEKWKGGDLDRLTKELLQLDPVTWVIIAGESIPQVLFKAVEKEIVALDLSSEKPWDKKRRVGEEAIKIAKGWGKALPMGVMNLLVERVGDDFALMKNEVDKLCCYVGKRDSIGVTDISAVSVASRQESLWKVAEALVFGGNFMMPKFKDLSEVLGVFGQIRYYLGIGLTLAAQSECGEAPSHPNVRPKQMGTFLPFSSKMGSQYFTKKTCELFEIEVNAKTVIRISVYSGTSLWYLFRMTLYLLPNLLGDETNPDESFVPALYEVIDSIDGFFVENAKEARKFLKYFDFEKHRDKPMVIVDKKTEVDAEMLQPVRDGEKWGIVTDAGVPCIADPGSKIVAMARLLNLEVIAFPGPCSIMLALMLSGFPGQQFVFQGYMPRVIDRSIRSDSRTQIFIQTPYRNMQTLESLLEVLDDSDELCIACDLLMPTQEVVVQRVSVWKRRFGQYDYHKRPAIFLAKIN